MKRSYKAIAMVMALVLVIGIASVAFPAPVDAIADQSHRDLARETVGEGIVMLKNEDVLPLTPTNTVALFGGGQLYTASTENGYQIGGGGSGWVEMDYAPLGPADVLLDAAAEGRISVYEPLTAAYRENINYVPDDAMYQAASEAADVAVMFITRFSKEGSDIAKSDYALSAEEEAMLQKLSTCFEKVVVLVNAPSVIATGWSVEGYAEGIDIEALLITYMGGEMGAYGMADILLGDVNPSGKLVDTYAYTIDDYPTTATFTESTAYVNYTEDIYVGYRYFETFAPDKVVYPFGYGLSYTTFQTTVGTVTAQNGAITVPVTVTNTGDTAGKEVVQLYYSAPQAGEGDAVLSRSAIDLAAYEKTGLLAPGASQTVELTLAIKDMASFDDTGVSGHQSCYVLEAGSYDIRVGTSVRDTRSVYEHVVDTATVTETCTAEIATTLTQRLTADGTYETLTVDEVVSPTAEDQTLGLDLTADNYVGIQYEDVEAGTATMDEFLAQMSYNELIDLCYGNQTNVNNGGINNPTGVRLGQGSIGFASNDTAQKYGVFNADTCDGPAGVDAGVYLSTYWPCYTLQACTWNTALIEAIGEATAEEALDSMVDIWLTPGMNIHRNPLCGRNFEYYSEDPVVTGKSAAALTRGVESKGVGAVLKHLCVNNKERNRNQSDSRVSEKALREIYLKGFRIACAEADPDFIMTSYNYMNGMEVSENRALLMDLVRGEWGWDGLFMSDWYNDSNIVNEVNAGNNVKMPTGSASALQAAVQAGQITRETLEENAKYVVKALAACPDYTVNRNIVHTLPENGMVKMAVTEFSFKDNQGYYKNVNGTLASGNANFFVEYTVDAPRAGTYALGMDYCNTGTGLTGALQVTVNGVQVTDVDVNAPRTGNDDTAFRYKEIGSVAFNEGENTIRFEHANGSTVSYMNFYVEAATARLDDITKVYQYVGGGVDNSSLSGIAAEGSAVYDHNGTTKTAFRVGATYKTDSEDFSTVVLDGVSYPILERGIILGAQGDLLTKDSPAKVSVTDGFGSRYWAYDAATSEVTYTVLVKNVTDAMKKNNYVARSYMVVQMGDSEQVIYSDISSPFSAQYLYNEAVKILAAEGKDAPTWFLLPDYTDDGEVDAP